MEGEESKDEMQICTSKLPRPKQPVLMKSTNMLAEILSFLPGFVVYHKMAMASKQFRKASRILGPMNKDRVIWLKQDKFR